jgi:hypothetical protein
MKKRIPFEYDETEEDEEDLQLCLFGLETIVGLLRLLPSSLSI